ncbi:MAG: hypothetical protein ACPL0B_02590 [Anaerolineales bacterium]
MDSKNKRKILSAPSSGFFYDLSARIKLILRLLADNRINPLLKLLPIASLIYLIVPDLAPGPIDDAMVIWLGAYLFVELCPQEIVREHLQGIHSSISGQNKDIGVPEIKEEDITDAEFWEEPK